MTESQRTDQPLLFPVEDTQVCRGSYKRGCRCEKCVEAKRAYHREYQRKYRIPYTNRRLEADPDFLHRQWKEQWERISQDQELMEERRRRGRARSKLPEEKARCLEKSAAKAKERRELLSKIKMERGCADCEYRGHPAALDFDHVLGEKIVNVALMGTFSLERITEEVAKCEVVCCRCHRIRECERRLSGKLPWLKQKVTTPNPKQALQHRCIARGRAFLAKQKLEQGCKDCGWKEHAEALDFDHVRGEKKFTVSSRAWWSIERLAEEVVKCEVVCANCHRIRTFERE